MENWQIGALSHLIYRKMFFSWPILVDWKGFSIPLPLPELLYNLHVCNRDRGNSSRHRTDDFLFSSIRLLEGSLGLLKGGSKVSTFIHLTSSLVGGKGSQLLHEPKVSYTGIQLAFSFELFGFYLYICTEGSLRGQQELLHKIWEKEATEVSALRQEKIKIFR